MSVRLIPSFNYKNDRKKILEDILEYALRSGNDAIPVLRFFRNEELNLQTRIKNSPLSAGIDFPKPVKKGTGQSGNYVILYTYLPPDALSNQDVNQVNLDSIMPTASNAFNEIVNGLNQSDFNE
jgi:hypothetical protein